MSGVGGGFDIIPLGILSPGERLEGTNFPNSYEMITAKKLHLLVTLPLIKLVVRVLHYKLSFVSSLANERVWERDF